MENTMNEKTVGAQETTEQTVQNDDAVVENEKQKEKAKATKRRKTVECRVDHANKQLIVTKKTSIPGTPAFAELVQQRAVYPDYDIVYRKIASSENRLSVKNLTVGKRKIMN